MSVQYPDKLVTLEHLADQLTFQLARFSSIPRSDAVVNEAFHNLGATLEVVSGALLKEVKKKLVEEQK